MVELYSFIFLNILGVMSPGPDFAIVTRYGLTGSRKAALFATFGIVCALVVHVIYCVSGVALFLNSSPQWLLVIKFLGGIYLTYLGLTMVLTYRAQKIVSEENLTNGAFSAGFFTNLLNPKATVFLLSLFGLYAQAMDSLFMKIAFAVSIPIIALSWFTLLSFMLTHPSLLPFLQKHQKTFVLMMGIALLVLGFIGLMTASVDYIGV